MNKDFRCVQVRSRGIKVDTAPYGREQAQKVRSFHQSFPEYTETPLWSLSSLAEELGVKNVYVKDESYRFGLNAFKVLGGSYAIGRELGKRLGLSSEELSCQVLTSEETRKRLGDMTFVTATDGNHGRGVAWTANRLGQKSVVFMPEGTASERLENIRLLGSDASITDMPYDDCVRKAKACADAYGWLLVQDTAWEEYEKIPGYIMQGYTTMALEALEQLHGQRPTHILLQAGVGSMAAAVAAFFADCFGQERPKVIIVEPHQADCFYRTAAADDGRLHFAEGPMNSIMAGLCCGEPCSIAWELLQEYADFCVAMPDYAAANGMRILANPLGNDPKVVAGESGASGFGLLTEVLRRKELAELKEKLQLDSESVVLCFSTEGATDRANYANIVWDGAYSNTDL